MIDPEVAKRNIALLKIGEPVPLSIGSEDIWPGEIDASDLDKPIDVKRRAYDLHCQLFKGGFPNGWTRCREFDHRTKARNVLIYLPYKLVATEPEPIWQERFEEICLRSGYAEAPKDFQWQFDYDGAGTPIEPRDPLYNRGRYNWWATEFPKILEMARKNPPSEFEK